MGNVGLTFIKHGLEWVDSEKWVEAIPLPFPPLATLRVGEVRGEVGNREPEDVEDRVVVQPEGTDRAELDKPVPESTKFIGPTLLVVFCIVSEDDKSLGR